MTATANPRWYNTQTKLWLSLLVWPVFAYGLYKTEILRKRTKQYIVGGAILCMLLAGFIPNKLEGKYKMIIRPEQEWMRNTMEPMNSYYEISKDQTIHYHTNTGSLGYGIINRYGKYQFNKKTKTLSIDWEDGQGPSTISLEKNGVGYKFNMGSTLYQN